MLRIQNQVSAQYPGDGTGSAQGMRVVGLGAADRDLIGALAEDLLIKAPIKEFGSGRMGVHPEGKPAQTTLRVLARYKAATLLEAEPHTGRRHQLRVHLYHAGHPILGDALYGKERPVGGAPRLMLHAFKAQFLHPDGKPMTLEAPPGTDFEEALREAAEG